MTPEPTAAQLAELERWHYGNDPRTVEQLVIDLRALGDGRHPRGFVKAAS